MPLHDMMRLAMLGLDADDCDALEALCKGNWDRVECTEGGVLRVRMGSGLSKRGFTLEFEEEPAPADGCDVDLHIELADSAPVETASPAPDMTLEQQEQAERRAAREEYMALVKAGVEEDVMWVECLQIEHHDPHWWEWEDPAIRRRMGEYVGCTGAGWV